MSAAELAAKSGHTPGPWAVEEPMDFELSIVEAGKPPHEWRFIAACPLDDDDVETGFPREEAEANARLIAAAPLLLEALLGVVAVADRKTDEFDRARAAIAAATGAEVSA